MLGPAISCSCIPFKNDVCWVWKEDTRLLSVTYVHDSPLHGHDVDVAVPNQIEAVFGCQRTCNCTQRGAGAPLARTAVCHVESRLVIRLAASRALFRGLAVEFRDVVMLHGYFLIAISTAVAVILPQAFLRWINRRFRLAGEL